MSKRKINLFRLFPVKKGALMLNNGLVIVLSLFVMSGCSYKSQREDVSGTKETTQAELLRPDQIKEAGSIFTSIAQRKQDDAISAAIDRIQNEVDANRAATQNLARRLTVVERPKQVTPQVIPENQSGQKTEVLQYHGNKNKGMPQWYLEQNLDYYTMPINIDIPGCVTATIEGHGKEYRKNGFILKQSDIKARPAVLLYSASCKHRGNITVEYKR